MIRIGHRGACGYETENSLRSFSKAIELDVDVIELDVRVCKSGEPVIFHDKSLEMITNGYGKISRRTLSELKSLKLENEEKILTLKEALDSINGRVPVNIHLKSKNTSWPTYKVVSRYIQEKKWRKDFFYISSFRKKEIKNFRKIDQDIKLSLLLLRKHWGMYNFAKSYGLYSLNMAYRKINKKFVYKTHQRGLKIFAWTVNKKEEIEKMKNLDVDGIISDFPDKI